jgi:hypothetical protein
LVRTLHTKRVTDVKKREQTRDEVGHGCIAEALLSTTRRNNGTRSLTRHSGLPLFGVRVAVTASAMRVLRHRRLHEHRWVLHATSVQRLKDKEVLASLGCVAVHVEDVHCRGGVGVKSHTHTRVDNDSM